MDRDRPVSGEFYRHFKGGIYQIRMLALDSGTRREMVVFQAMYPPYTCLVESLEEFMDRADRAAYPDGCQEYRYQKVLPEETVPGQPESCAAGQPCGEAGCGAVPEEEISDEELIRALRSGQAERCLGGRIAEGEIAHRGLLKLLDAETFRERRQILAGLKPYMDKHMLNNIAVAFDIVLEEGDIETQYTSIMQCLDAFARYEGGRLR